MPERFTETMRAASEAGWSHAVQHRFVNELFAGAVPDAVMARYLIQDHRFLDSFLVLLGAALASADTFAARLRFGRFIGMVSAEENTYFLRAFEALGVSETRRASDPDTQSTVGFKAIMREAADTRNYAAALSVLVVAEWLYLDWASRAPQPLPANFVHAEWITLHDNPDFRGFVDFTARGVGPGRPRAPGSLPRLLPPGCSPRILFLRSRLHRPDLIPNRGPILAAALATFACLEPAFATESLRCARFSREEMPAPMPSQYPSALERLKLINQAVKSTRYSILFFGDSLTEGWDAAIWDRSLASRGALNAGVSGDRTDHLLWRLQHGNLAGPEPRAVVLLIGPAVNYFEGYT